MLNKVSEAGFVGSLVSSALTNKEAHRNGHSVRVIFCHHPNAI
jgi:hypothetical protein